MLCIKTFVERNFGIYFDGVPQDGHFPGEMVILRVHGLHLLADLQARVLHGSNPQFLLQLPHQHRLFLKQHPTTTTTTQSVKFSCFKSQLATWQRQLEGAESEGAELEGAESTRIVAADGLAEINQILAADVVYQSM